MTNVAFSQRNIFADNFKCKVKTLFKRRLFYVYTILTSMYHFHAIMKKIFFWEQIGFTATGNLLKTKMHFKLLNRKLAYTAAQKAKF